LEIQTGVVADIFSRKLSLILAAAFMVAGHVWYPLIPQFWSFMIGEFLLATGLALASGATEALACDSMQKEQFKTVLPRLNSLSMLGIMIGPLVGGVLLHWIDPREVMLLQAIPSLLGFLVAFTLVEPPRQGDDISETTRFWETFQIGWQFFRSHKNMQLLALDMAVVAGVGKMMVWLHQAVLMGKMEVSWFGWIMSSAVLLEVIAMSAYSWIAKKRGNRHEIIFWSSLVPAIGFFLAALAGQLWLILLGIYLAIGIGMSRKPFFAVIFNEKITSAQRATILSTVAMSSQIFLAVLNPIVGWLADWSVEGTFLILGSGLVLFVCFSGWKLQGYEL
jgi:DHA3 family tetracycline resistance protein-like MFS transporter